MVSQPVVVYPATRIIMSDAYDLVQPWRKTFPICRPPIPGDKADAHRFAREFEEGLDQEDAGQSWTLGDVARGEHDGGLAAGAAVLAPGAGAAARLARRQCDTRRKKLMAFLMKYIQDVPLQNTLRAQAHGEAAWREYRRLEVWVCDHALQRSSLLGVAQDQSDHLGQH